MVTVGERRGGGVHSEPGGHDHLSVCLEQRYLRRVPVTYLTLHYWVTENQLNTGEIIMENCYMRYLYIHTHKYLDVYILFYTAVVVYGAGVFNREGTAGLIKEA